MIGIRRIIIVCTKNKYDFYYNIEISSKMYQAFYRIQYILMHVYRMCAFTDTIREPHVQCAASDFYIHWILRRWRISIICILSWM